MRKLYALEVIPEWSDWIEKEEISFEKYLDRFLIEFYSKILFSILTVLTGFSVKNEQTLNKLKICDLLTFMALEKNQTIAKIPFKANNTNLSRDKSII